ncbi:TPA: hypothetical protein RQO69_000066 [Klebsiella oxytoca]|nr:hypothetical protein [Klebsiella oxytoca]
MNNEIERIAQHNDMSVEFVTWFFNEKKSACGEHWFLVLGAMWEGWKGRSIEMDRLAAENVKLKRVPETDSVAMLLALDSFRSESLRDVGLHKAFKSLMCHRKTPATDRIVAGIKADGVEEFSADLGAVYQQLRQGSAQAKTIKSVIFRAAAFSAALREGADK